MNNQPNIIDELVKDLDPVTERKISFRYSILIWLVVISMTAIAMIMFAPIRTNAFDQLINTGRFQFEIILGLAITLLFVNAALQSGSPDLGVSHRFWKWGIALAVIWLCHFAYSFYDPVFPPSMSGKRVQCYFEALAYSLPMMFVGICMIKRMYPLRPIISGSRLGLAVGVSPALLMQVACMHEPLHTLTHHLLPVVVTTIVGAIVGFVFLRRNSMGSSEARINL